MKTFTLTLFSLLIAVVVSAQSQRLVLLEYFTQASCGPCATYNPTINAMLAANPNTVIALKYQTSWPGVDPMNTHNPTEVANRVTYYGVSGVPNGVIDGNYYNGHPTGVNINTINTRASVPSPFQISVNHTLSENRDSIHVTATITATQNISEPLTARIAVIEKHISFNNPPGTNGEKDFYSVMKKMLPNVNGNSLPATMNANDAITINESWKLANIYDLNQVAVVAFVQNTTSKEVHQAALSAPQLLPHDAGVSNITSVPLFQCSSVINPVITIKNYGASTLTSANINYNVNWGPITTIPWTGSLASGATTTYSLPAITVPLAGYRNILEVSVSHPNNLWDFQESNDKFEKYFNIYYYSAPGPLNEGFSTTPFPPTDWTLNNPDNGPTWTRVTNAGGFGNSSQSARMFFYASPPGQVDELIMKPLDMRFLSGPADLEFNVAYAQYQAENDRLEVMVSGDCGASWTTVFNKAGAALSTTNATTSSFIPNASQWRAETADLSAFVGSEVIIKFRATSNYGNNLFVDDINIPQLTSIGQQVEFATDLNVYPVPVYDHATVSFSLKKAQNIAIKVYNNLGALVMDDPAHLFPAGEHAINFSSTGLDAGIYFLNMTSEEGVMTRKVTIVK